VQWIWNAIDLHIVALLTMLVLPSACLPWWCVIVIVIVPQGIILTHALDHNSMRWQRWMYLAVNECVVALSAGLSIGLRQVGEEAVRHLVGS
jgi:hypothetical protein